MKILDFNKPAKLRPTAEHNAMHTSDSGVAGTYVPNMSDEDAARWKAKYIKGENERIEIRKSFHMAQIVIVVRKFAPTPMPKLSALTAPMKVYNEQRTKWREAQNNIKISMNGSLWLSHTDWLEMRVAIEEAEEFLAKT